MTSNFVLQQNLNYALNLSLLTAKSKLSIVNDVIFKASLLFLCNVIAKFTAAFIADTSKSLLAKIFYCLEKCACYL